MTFTRRQAVAVIGALGATVVSGCATLPGNRPPPRFFNLSPKSHYDQQAPTVSWQMVVETPTASAGLSTMRIALQRRQHELEYFAQANWVDTAPKMVQTLIIESFENSGRIVAVGRESVGLRADFTLKTELREFQVDYIKDGTPRARVAVSAKLVRMPKRMIVGSWANQSYVRAEDSTLEAVVAAFDESLGKVMKRLVTWTLIRGQEVVQAKRD
tara:strand:- start:136 stop:777 length:642 start_codon:yes stop_codon:yes gene_type:complete